MNKAHQESSQRKTENLAGMKCIKIVPRQKNKTLPVDFNLNSTLLLLGRHPHFAIKADPFHPPYMRNFTNFPTGGPT